VIEPNVHVWTVSLDVPLDWIHVSYSTHSFGSASNCYFSFGSLGRQSIDRLRITPPNL